MGWLRRLLGGGGGVALDPERQQALLRDVRHSYGAHARIRFPDQIDAIGRLLADDDGLVVAAGIVCEAAEEAHADLQLQAQEVFRRTGRRLLVHRRNYRPLWKEAGQWLRWPLGALPSGLHPYAQVAAAVTVVGGRAKRLDQVTDPQPFVTRLFEVLDLTTTGWEFGRVRVDTDSATLVERLTGTAAQVLATMDDPPRLPPPVREMMRRNHSIDVYDPAGPRVVGRINLGARLRETLLA
ncbi:hypothetical protein ACH495_27635 [Micromonospora sp. NPDC018662]|uniref:hypothetical protein n=1 Tax=Micromonospora sp. NPDC018662 TaxID=3364238 RepID=UPI0037B650F9